MAHTAPIAPPRRTVAESERIGQIAKARRSTSIPSISARFQGPAELTSAENKHHDPPGAGSTQRAVAAPRGRGTEAVTSAPLPKVLVASDSGGASVPYRTEGTLNTTTLSVTAEQRGPIHRQVAQRLSGIADVNGAYECGDFLYAKQLGEEFAEDIALLADLGWDPDDPRESYELKMPAGELLQVLQRLRGEAEAGLDDPDERRATEEAAQINGNYERTASVCSELIEGLYRDPGAR